MKLVQSSIPGAVDRDEAIRLLAERATLTRMVCRELLDTDINAADRRPQTALFLLLRWINENQKQYVRVEPRADDGVRNIIIPEGYEGIISEIEAGAEVCKALFSLLTADNSLQTNQDRKMIGDHLTTYWKRYPSPVAIARLFP